jgi:hypothetical protein
MRHANRRPGPETSSHSFHVRLAAFNVRRLNPQLIGPGWVDDIRLDVALRIEEGAFIENERSRVRARAATAPARAEDFLSWFQGLQEHGPGQNDPLFEWLEKEAPLAQMRWFLEQEAAGEAGFEDLVALTQVRLPVQAKLEMARNYWDEMGRGKPRGMHGPMLAAMVAELSLAPTPEGTCWESLAVANLMAGLALNRRYAYHSIGALGAIEMTAPGRATRVQAGLERLGVALSAQQYFRIHAGMDILHSKTWNKEVICSIVAGDPGTARAIAEGALMRLGAGARCFERYRAHFNLGTASEERGIARRQVRFSGPSRAGESRL